MTCRGLTTWKPFLGRLLGHLRSSAIGAHCRICLQNFGEWWNWLLLFMGLYPATLACTTTGANSHLKRGWKRTPQFGFKVARGVSAGLWLIFAAGVLWNWLGDSEISLFALAFIVWAISIQELRVANVVRWSAAGDTNEAQSAPTATTV